MGITAAVQGAGGFGKTIVAKVVAAGPRVLRHYRDRVYWVTLGRDVGLQALPDLLGQAICTSHAEWG